MPLELSTAAQRRGLLLFALGTLVYFGSWLAVMASPASSWSTSALGFIAPAYTPALWLLGLALIGRRLFWGQLYRWWMYVVISALFLAAHITHTAFGVWPWPLTVNHDRARKRGGEPCVRGLMMTSKDSPG